MTRRMSRRVSAKEFDSDDEGIVSEVRKFCHINEQKREELASKFGGPSTPVANGNSSIGEVRVSGFRTPETVRKTRDSPALKFARPHILCDDMKGKSFNGENPLLSQVFHHLPAASASAPKK